MVAICYKLHCRLGTSLVIQSLRASHIPAQLPLKMTTHHIFNGQDGEVRKKTEDRNMRKRKVWLEIYSIGTEELTSLYKPQINHPPKGGWSCFYRCTFNKLTRVFPFLAEPLHHKHTTNLVVFIYVILVSAWLNLHHHQKDVHQTTSIHQTTSSPSLWTSGFTSS